MSIRAHDLTLRSSRSLPVVRPIGPRSGILPMVGELDDAFRPLRESVEVRLNARFQPTIDLAATAVAELAQAQKELESDLARFIAAMRQAKWPDTYGGRRVGLFRRRAWLLLPPQETLEQAGIALIDPGKLVWVYHLSGSAMASSWKPSRPRTGRYTSDGYLSSHIPKVSTKELARTLAERLAEANVLIPPE